MDIRAGPAPVSGKVVKATFTIAVFGATGVTGGLVFQRGLAHGDEGVALVRDPGPMTFEHPNLFVMEENPRSLADVDRCVSIADAVIHGLAPIGRFGRVPMAVASGLQSLPTRLHASCWSRFRLIGTCARRPVSVTDAG